MVNISGIPEEAVFPVERELATVAADVRAATADICTVMGHDSNALSRPGKMLRPALTLLSALAAGRRTRKVVRLATALELLHLATLVHDDILDKAATRHGLPTVAEAVGPEVALLAGDHLFAAAVSQLSGQSPMVIRECGALIRTLATGEIQQQRLAARGPDRNRLDIAGYLEVIAKKTAAFTAACCRLGALCADGEAVAVEALGEFGFAFGMAFQIHDDTLDIMEPAGTIGKPVGQDLRCGILTLPVLYALSVPERPSWLPSLIDGFEPTEGNLALLREACSITAGLARSARLAASYLATARKALSVVRPGRALQALNAVLESAAVSLADAEGGADA